MGTNSPNITGGTIGPYRLMSIILAAILLAATFSPTSVDAKSRTCLRLERQLASLSSGRRSGNPLKLLRYNSAIKRQKSQITQAKRQLRRGGCSNPSSRNVRTCKRLSGSLKKMKSNIKKLRVKRDKYSSKGGSSKRQRRRIKNALKANRCNRLRPVIASNRDGVLIERSAGRRTVIDQVFGDDRREWERRNRYRNREYYDDEGEYPGSRRPGGETFRTLCVRTCDGYYFPISFSTTPRNFDRDAEACSAKCPGTETELYHHSTDGESPEDMRSVSSEQPYKELPTAFSYRTAVTPGCGCKFKQINYEAIAGEENQDGNKVTKSATIIATPTFKIDPGEDPDTLENQRGNFIPTQVIAKSAKPAKLGKPGKRKVRVVGEAFFPGQ